MNTRQTPIRETYDPFGEPVDAARLGTTEAGDRRARNAALAVFWTAAMLLTAGRIYYSDVVPLHVAQAVHVVVASLTP